MDIKQNFLSACFAQTDYTVDMCSACMHQHMKAIIKEPNANDALLAIIAARIGVINGRIPVEIARTLKRQSTKQLVLQALRRIILYHTHKNTSILILPCQSFCIYKKTATLHVEVADVQRILLNEIAARLHRITHER